MKFEIDRVNIRDVLAKVQGIANRRSGLAITETVLIRASGENVSILATDTETGLEGFYRAEIRAEGSVALNAKKLFEIVREFPTDTIVLHEVENRWIEIGSEGVEYHIVGLNPDDFPESPVFEDEGFFEIDSLSLKKMIEKTTIIAGSTEDKRKHVHGVWFERIAEDDAGIVRMLSTDGGRLAKVDFYYEPEDGITESPGVLIPKKGLSEIGKFLENVGAVQIGVIENYFVLKKENETLYARLMEGQFPNYQGVLKKGDEHAIEIDKSVFTRMLRRMSILTSDEYKGVIFAFKPNSLLITTTNPDLGESQEEMVIDYEGEEMEIAFNPRFFLDALNSIEDATVVIYIASKKRPCLLEGLVDKSFLSIIMPMQI